jgi:dienelactone hydrolase
MARSSGEGHRDVGAARLGADRGICHGPRVRTWLVLITVALSACRASEAPVSAVRALVDAEAAPSPASSVGVPTTTTARGAPDPGCTADGCLRSVTTVGTYSAADLRPYLSPDVTIEHGYGLSVIHFMSAGHETMATVAIPHGVEVPRGGWHVVANNHGTSGLEDPCVVVGTLGGAGLAGTFGARGFIGVAVEYPGLGTPGLHPYLVSSVEGRAALDALRATQRLAAWRGVRTSGRSAVVGLSQGGHATIAAAALHKSYAPELDVRAFAAVAPANMFEEEWRAGVAVDGFHVGFHAMAFYAWAAHYGFSGAPLWHPRVAGTIDTIMRGSCVYPLTDGGPTVMSALGSSASTIFAPELLAEYATGRWQRYAAFHAYFTENRLVPYAQTAPLKIYQGDADTIVPRSSTDKLVAELRAGGVVVDYERVPEGTHTDVAFGFLASMERRTTASLVWLRAQLDAAR